MTDSIAFALLLLTTSQLTIRPAAFNPALGAVPFFQIFIVLSLILSVPGVLQQLSGRSVSRNPVTACVLGFFGLFFLSAIVNQGPSDGVSTSIEFLKAVIYYLLIVGSVRDRRRMAIFAGAYVAFITFSVAVALATYYHKVELPGYEQVAEFAGYDRVTHKVVLDYRLSGPRASTSGDPNDFCLTILPGLFCAAYCVLASGRLLWRLVGMLLTGFLLWGVLMTKSRGGLLGVMAGVTVLCWSRYGTKRAILLVALAIGGLLAVAGGRLADISTRSGTGQIRVQIWLLCFQLIKQHPILGVGPFRISDYSSYVAHNSYLHAYTELGLAGGVLFTGIFFCAAWGLYRLRRSGWQPSDAVLWRFQPFMLAIVVGSSVSMSALSRAYVIESYTIVGMASAYYRCITDDYRDTDIRSDLPLLVRITAVSLAYLIVVRFQCLSSI
jgi:O-antigen ligase